MAADRLADVREAAALKAIVDLGGRVDYDRQAPAFNGPMPSLQVVIGPQWKGGVEGLTHLKEVRRASTISFHSSGLGEQAATALPELPQVQRIEFYGGEISPEAVAKLKERLPTNVAIEVRSGARLGIAGRHPLMGAPNPVGVGATVQDVLPGSAAAKAGIQPGDVIAQIAGVEVKDFEHLTQEIAKCQPGDKAALKVQRQAPPGQPLQMLDITVTFDRWGDEATADNPGVALPGALQPTGGLPLGVQRSTIIINDRR